MKMFRTMEELKEAPQFIQDHYSSIMDDIYSETGDNMAHEEFQYSLGGDVFFIESVDDLKQIQTNHTNPETGEYFSILDVSDSYDYCEWHDEDYVNIFYVTNNAGGPSFWIPRDIVEQVPNITESIEKTKQLWS